MPNETQCPHRRTLTKDQWYRLCIEMAGNGYPKFANWLWGEMDVSLTDSPSCNLTDEEVQWVDAAAKRAGITPKERVDV